MKPEKQKILDQEMTRIYQRDGQVKPSVFLGESEPTDAPCHDYFEWNDGKAGHEFRLIQARKFIRVGRVIIEKEPVRLVHIPRISVEDADQSGSEGDYKPISVVVKDVDAFNRALAEARIKLRSAEKAVRDLESAVPKSPNKKKNVASFILAAMKAIETANTALSRCA